MSLVRPIHTPRAESIISANDGPFRIFAVVFAQMTNSLRPLSTLLLTASAEQIRQPAATHFRSLAAAGLNLLTSLPPNILEDEIKRFVNQLVWLEVMANALEACTPGKVHRTILVVIREVCSFVALEGAALRKERDELVMKLCAGAGCDSEDTINAVVGLDYKLGGVGEIELFLEILGGSKK